MIKILDWDTNFFNLKIGKAEKEFNPSEIDFDLIYCFANPNDEQLNNFFRSIGAELVDRKTLYKKDTPKIDVVDFEQISELTSEDLSAHFYALAMQSGEYSRFKMDSNFREDSFSKLYRIWLEKSLSHEFADRVYGRFIDKKIGGFITVSNKETFSNIGLIAVDTAYRGQGIGKSLLNSCYHFSCINNLPIIEVYTQGMNKIACAFYEANGFKKSEETNIYHFWKNK